MHVCIVLVSHSLRWKPTRRALGCKMMQYGLEGSPSHPDSQGPGRVGGWLMGGGTMGDESRVRFCPRPWPQELGSIQLGADPQPSVSPTAASGPDPKELHFAKGGGQLNWKAGACGTEPWHVHIQGGAASNNRESCVNATPPSSKTQCASPGRMRSQKS